MQTPTTTEYLEIEGKQLYWGREFSKNEIFFRQLSVLLKNIIRPILFLTALAGLAALGYHLWLVVQNQLPLLSLSSWQGRYVNYFWWSVILDMYLVYQFGLDSKRTLQVIKKSFEKKKITKDKLKRVEMSDSFTPEALKIIDKAFIIASKQKKVFNLLYLFNQSLSAKIFLIIFGRLGVSVKDLRTVVKKFIENFPASETAVDPQIYQILSQAYHSAYQEGRAKVEVTDLLQATVNQDKMIQEVLFDLKITSEKIANVIMWANIQKKLKARYQRYRTKSYFKPKGTMDRAMTALATPVLDSFSEDFTQLARAGYLHLCVAREKEIEEIFHIIEGGNNT